MLIADSTIAAAVQRPPSPSTARRFPRDGARAGSPSAQDRTPREVSEAIEILRAAGLASAGMLTEREAAAMELLYRRYAGLVARVAATLLRSAADAEDVAHDVFLNLPRSLRRYQPGNFEGWLKTVAARTALMRIRRCVREREVRVSLAWGADELCGDTQGDTLVDGDRVRRAVAQLPDSLRHVVMLRLFGGLSHAEIARMLGLTPNACEVRLCRAIKQLRAMVGEAG